MYELVSSDKALVLRRGTPFELLLTFQQRGFDLNTDRIKFTFTTGICFTFFPLKNEIIISKEATQALQRAHQQLLS